MNLKKYALVVLAVVGFAACNKNNSNDPGHISTGEDTKISLSLSIAASGTKTYAPGEDANATVDELEMNTVDIFIYDNVSPFALTYKHLEDAGDVSADFVTDGISGARRLKDNIILDAKTGKKLIYVGVNLPASIVNQIKATQGLASLDGVFSAIELYEELFQSLLPAGMAMFSNEGEIATLQKTQVGGVPSTNKVSFELTRMLAKVTVDGTDSFKAKIAQGGSLTVMDGSIDLSTLEYSLTQVNTSTYLKGNGVVPSTPSNDFFTSGGLGFGIGSAPKYVPENISENELTKLTFALVQATFVPEVFEDEAEFNYAPGGDFFTVTDPSNGSIKYFINQGRGSQVSQGKEFRKYTRGLCYYHIYLNPANDHKVIRNEYYDVKISKIRGIGKSSEASAFESGGKLYNSELLHAHATSTDRTTLYLPRKAATNANIEAFVTIVPWNVVVSEHEL